MGLILTFLLILSVPSTLTQEDEEHTCTAIDKAALIVGTPSPTCSRMLEELATACGDFISCAMIYSKPMCLCDACVEQYNSVIQYYHNITEYKDNSSLSAREKECEGLLRREDGVKAFENSVNLVKSLWSSANCKSCKNNSSEEFYHRLNDMLDCWAYYIIDSIPIGPLNGTSLLGDSIVDRRLNVNHTVCTNCSDAYRNLSSYYDDNYDSHHAPCADIKMHMEMTRLQWSKSFGCDKPKRDLRLVGGIAAAFVILIVVFYGGVYFYGYLEEKKEKRIYSVNPSNERNFESTDVVDHPQHLVREETALPVRRTNIN